MEPHIPPAPKLPLWVTEAFPPSRDNLLSAISALTTDKILEEISAADYEEDFDEHYATLTTIRDSGNAPTTLEWVPKEVLDLTSWCNPENSNSYTSLEVREKHIMRMFSCATLLKMWSDPALLKFAVGPNQPLAALIESALVVAENLPRNLAEFITFIIPKLNIDDELPFFALGLLLTVVLAKLEDSSDQKLIDLLTYVKEATKWERENNHYYREDREARSLAHLTYYNLRHDSWNTLTQQAFQMEGNSQNGLRVFLGEIKWGITEEKK